jgi:hypothetical protein
LRDKAAGGRDGEQSQLVAVSSNATRPGGQATPPRDDDAVSPDRGAESACRRGTARMRASSSSSERLDQVVVGPELESVQPILDGVARGHEDDRQITRGAQLSRQLEPVAAGSSTSSTARSGRGGDYVGTG